MATMPAISVSDADAIALIHRMLADADAGWHIGTFGALAEFHHVAGDLDPVITLVRSGGSAVTSRGGISISLPDVVRVVAYEGLSKRPEAWTHAIAFCVPASTAGMGRRRVLTQLGADHDALREEDRAGILFDLGLAAEHVDFCIRTADPALIAILRQHQGQSVLDPESPAMAAIKTTSPHRISRSGLGRVEVYQPIPPPTPGARAPIGPHTHLLPDLLRLARTHSANAPVPAGWLPALYLHPPHPVTDRLGQSRQFDQEAFTAFEATLAAFAPPHYQAEKDRIRAAVFAGTDPYTYLPAPDRAARMGARVALRQLQHTHPQTPGLDMWLTVFDRAAGHPTEAEGTCA
ncbi:conserved hypothetical protein [Candidatus Defluviicoccus seviourii]|uniref:Uncharacterized protein n=1 Tax=Candidatus Defluviicoccus seviourii TaxID=2565273 RepID=A0A564WBS7_9PROT|nr:conserved hypothetical protein [Candidatus Defluviicoccus seviourii]